MTAPASAAPGAGDPRATGPSASALWSKFEEDAHAARLRGVPSGVLEDRARLVRFVVSERGHVCSAQDPQAIRRPMGSGIARGERIHCVWAKTAANAAHEQVRARERRRGERHEPEEGCERDEED